MTAIFAYSDSKTAFMAADTKRVDNNFSLVALKVFRWSDAIVFAQTGSGKYLGELAAQMMAHCDQLVDFDLKAGLLGLFQKYRQDHYDRAIAKIGAQKAAGRFVVACADEGPHPAEILTLDFATGGSNRSLPVGWFMQMAQIKLDLMPRPSRCLSNLGGKRRSWIPGLSNVSPRRRRRKGCRSGGPRSWSLPGKIR